MLPLTTTSNELTEQEIKSYRTKFNVQKYSAINKRNIEWDLSFEDWLNWWKMTGKLEQRGRKGDQYVMARFQDKGSYSLENIYCCTANQNNKDQKGRIGNRLKGIKSSRFKSMIKTPFGVFESIKAAVEMDKDVRWLAVMWNRIASEKHPEYYRLKN